MHFLVWFTRPRQGEDAALVGVQMMIADSLHEESKSQNVTAESAVGSDVLKHTNGKLTGSVKCGRASQRVG